MLGEPRTDDAYDVAEARRRMAEADAQLQRIETAAEGLLAAGELEAAAAWAETAGHFAALNHPGRFASPRLERVLAEIARAAVPAPTPRPRAAPPRRVLHVLTEAYATGGHTRLVWRWIERDAAREHSVALTAPNAVAPPELHAAAEASGGVVHFLRDPGRLERARALRALADEADLVVLHVHMFDVVAPIALGDRPAGPPVLFEDHADHLFWLGGSAADAVAGLRQPAVELAATRRGVGADRALLLPIPVHPVERAMPAAEARVRLGIDQDAPVLLTVAMPYKYAPVVRPSFFDAAVPLVSAHPECVLLAVGPEPAGPWAQAAEATGGRVRALGVQQDLSPYYHAATLYLDSYPFSSNTALIEAAGHAVPVLSFSPDPKRQGVLLSHDPGIEPLIVRAATPEAYRAAGDALLADLEGAAALGERTRAGIERAHSGPGWQERLEHAYAVTVGAGRAALMPASRSPERATDWEGISTLLFAHAGQAPSLTDVAGAHRVTAPGVAPDLPEQAEPLPWDAVAVVDGDPAAVRRALDALARLDDGYTIARRAVAVAPHALEAVVALIEDWLDGRAELDLDLDLVPVEDPAQLVALGTVLVLAPGDPLAAAARRRGVAVVEA
jgi:hypothetical protein